MTKKGSKKSPIQPKSKEQIAREMEVKRKRIIVVEHFYPALVEATVSIDEAKMLIQAATSLIMESVLKTMQERKFWEIKDELINKLSPTDERKKEITALMDVLDDENLFVAREIIEGMTRAIDHCLMVETRNRKLDTLKPDWEQMLN